MCEKYASCPDELHEPTAFDRVEFLFSGSKVEPLLKCQQFVMLFMNSQEVNMNGCPNS